jgi:dTDP-4-dehydrorhamnose 3,5-epimerase
MIFTETILKGAFIIDVDRKMDDRGFFGRTYCRKEFAEHGLKDIIAQANVSFNHVTGTLRGFHFQYPPAAECKLVCCTRGRILDVIIDLRPESETFLNHVAVELSEDNFRALYVPERFAHGYLTLDDNTVTNYLVSEFYTPGTEGGLRYDDPQFAVEWPAHITTMSEKDKNWQLFDEIKETLIRNMQLKKP